ncbi:hypothetical protein QUF58_13740 [Anaerolineales bacterium HSG24]|nr:hypothetical protein [Anaerolineales bacterium HSG24]
MKSSVKPIELTPATMQMARAVLLLWASGAIALRNLAKFVGGGVLFWEFPI